MRQALIASDAMYSAIALILGNSISIPAYIKLIRAAALALLTKERRETGSSKEVFAYYVAGMTLTLLVIDPVLLGEISELT